MRTKRRTVEYEDYNFSVDVPKQCPHCGTSIEPLLYEKYCEETSHREYGNSTLCTLCKCPDCKAFFFASYHVKNRHGNTYETDLPKIYPTPCYLDGFDPYIEEVSPQFVKIYNQAYKAEQYGLDEICGVGYRKALEFLVKDYAVIKFQEDKLKILNEALSATISRFDDTATQLKNIASRAAWLGNDQTHYVQKFTDRDISDLKTLLEITVHWILLIHNTELLTLEIQPQKQY